MQNRGPDSPRDGPRMSPSEPALRIILRRLREIMAEPSDGQSRLDRIVRQIAGVMVAEVCSIYLKRQDGSLELFATEGLNPAAVHNTFMMRGEGLVGRCAELAVPINEPDAQNHPAFSYRPETGEEVYHSFLAVPILRGGDVLGVLTVQNKTHKEYSDEDVEVLQTTAMVLAEHLVSGAVSGANAGPAFNRTAGHVVRGQPLSEGLALGHVVLHETTRRRHRAEGRGPRGGGAPARDRRGGAQDLHRRDLGAGRARLHRRAPRRARSLPHVRPRPRLAQAHEGGDQARHDGRGRRRARAERHPRAHAAPGRQLLARAPARPRRAVQPPAAHPGRPPPIPCRHRRPAARHRADRPHHGRSRPARLRPLAPARPGARGLRRPEPRRHRRQGARHRRRRQCPRRHGAGRPRQPHHRRCRHRRGPHPPVERGHRRLRRQGPLPRPPPPQVPHAARSAGHHQGRPAHRAAHQCRAADGRAASGRVRRRGHRPLPHRAAVHGVGHPAAPRAADPDVPRGGGGGRAEAGRVPHPRRRRRQDAALSAPAAGGEPGARLARHPPRRSIGRACCARRSAPCCAPPPASSCACCCRW